MMYQKMIFGMRLSIMNTKQYDEFHNNMSVIKNNIQKDNNYLTRLLFANAITCFEVYLQSVFLYLLDKDSKLLENLTLSNKFKNIKISLNVALKNNMKVFLKEMLKNIVFHNLSDIEPLFKEVLGVYINYKNDDSILKMIQQRHDIIHRNGKSKSDEPVIITDEYLVKSINDITFLVSDIDSQIIKNYY